MKKLAKALALNRETLRPLTAGELAQVVGAPHVPTGADPTCDSYIDCDDNRPGCTGANCLAAERPG